MDQIFLTSYQCLGMVSQLSLTSMVNRDPAAIYSTMRFRHIPASYLNMHLYCLPLAVELQRIYFLFLFLVYRFINVCKFQTNQTAPDISESETEIWLLTTDA